MMNAVSNTWLKSKKTDHSQLITASDLAFGWFLLKFYGRSIPDKDVIKREKRRSERKHRLDGKRLKDAIDAYMVIRERFKKIRAGLTKRKNYPLDEMEKEIVDWIDTRHNVEIVVEKSAKKRKLAKLSETSIEHPVDLFCETDEAPTATEI
jgi:hypothetical protein